MVHTVIPHPYFNEQSIRPPLCSLFSVRLQLYICISQIARSEILIFFEGSEVLIFLQSLKGGFSCFHKKIGKILSSQPYLMNSP